jgi:alpha-1,6-mannosyltransferase
MHAWYVVWGGVLLAACAGTRARRWAVVLGAALCFSAVPDQLGGTLWSVLAVPLCLSVVVVDAVRTVFPATAPRWAPAGAAADTA